jgi:hypothetical protein
MEWFEVFEAVPISFFFASPETQKPNTSGSAAMFHHRDDCMRRLGRIEDRRCGISTGDRGITRHSRSQKRRDEEETSVPKLIESRNAQRCGASQPEYETINL